jgi:PadR family transcriptional regulator, regulatory protein PadR
MRKDALLGQSEMLVLIAVLRLREEAYGVPISREISAEIGRDVAIAGIYSTLERLERSGLVKAETGEPTAVRGGRAKTYFAVTAEGLRQLRASQRILQKFWDGLPKLEGRRA